MFDALAQIWNVIRYLPEYLMVGIIDVINLFFAGITAMMLDLYSLLPDMPGDVETWIGLPAWLDWLAWAYPIGSFVAIWTTLLGLWLLFLPIRTLLRWVKLV